MKSLILPIFSIDDLPIKGPNTCYPDKYGRPETIKANPGIQRYIWEHALDVHHILHQLGHVEATISANKIQMCKPDVVIVGQKCST